MTTVPQQETLAQTRYKRDMWCARYYQARHDTIAMQHALEDLTDEMRNLVRQWQARVDEPEDTMESMGGGLYQDGQRKGVQDCLDALKNIVTPTKDPCADPAR
jgi:hypothetical protein